MKRFLPFILIAICILVVIISSLFSFRHSDQTQTPLAPEAITAITIPESSPSSGQFINTLYGYSVIIPDGYRITTSSEDGTSHIIIENASDDRPTPLPECTIEVTAGTYNDAVALILASHEELEDPRFVEDIAYVNPTVTIVSTQPIQHGTLSGMQYTTKTAYADNCPVYEFYAGDTTYRFSLYECRPSDIFEEVVESFELRMNITNEE